MGWDILLRSLLCGVLMIGSAAILCGWIERRFACLARQARVAGRLIAFPNVPSTNGFQWSLRSTLLSICYVAIVLGASVHNLFSRELILLTGVLVGALIGAFDNVIGIRIKSLGSRPLAGAVGGVLGASVTLLLPLAVNSLSTTFHGALWLAEFELSLQILWWLALSALIGGGVGFVAESMRYRRGRLGEHVTLVDDLPQISPTRSPLCRRWASVATVAAIGSLLLHAAAHASFLTVGHDDWFSVPGKAEGPTTLVIGRFDQHESIDDQIYCAMYPDDFPNDETVVLDPWYPSFVNLFPRQLSDIEVLSPRPSWNIEPVNQPSRDAVTLGNSASLVNACNRRGVLPKTLSDAEIRELLQTAGMVSIGCGMSLIDTGGGVMEWVGASMNDYELQSLPGFESSQAVFALSARNHFWEFSGPGFAYERRGDLLYLVKEEQLSHRELSVLAAAVEHFARNDRWRDDLVHLELEKPSGKFRPTKDFLTRLDHVSGEFDAYRNGSYQTADVIATIAIEAADRESEFTVTLVENSRQSPQQIGWTRKSETSTFAWMSGHWQCKQESANP